MSSKENHYRPLPDSVSIKQSEIEGLGLYATSNIQSYTCLGLSHIYNLNYKDEYIRTPLGGFINYSNEPNCELNTTYAGQETNDNVNNLYLWTLVDIEAGEELTLKYMLYDPTPLSYNDETQ